MIYNVQGVFFNCSALKMTKHPNCSPNCSAQRVSSLSKLALKKLNYFNCSFSGDETVHLLKLFLS